MLRKFIKNADNPIKRIGVVLIIVPVIVILLTSLHWNIKNKGFIYEETYIYYEKTEIPSDTPDGHRWLERREGWELYSQECINNSDKWNSLAAIRDEKCLVKVKVKPLIIKRKWKSSIDRYFRELYNYRYGDYYLFFILSVVSLFLGVFMYLGFLNRLVSWIKTGE